MKILDFGLAKLTQPEPPRATVATCRRTRGAREPGMVLGTVGYMSPEQVRGASRSTIAPTSSRSARVLYEMLTGRARVQARLRGRDDERDPEGGSAAISPTTSRDLPPALERIVRHCLEKNPEERFQSARDIAFNLESIGQSSSTSGKVIAQPATTRSRWRRRRW